MATYHGKASGVAFAGSAVVDEDVVSWSIDTTSEASDATAIGDSWEEVIAGLTDFSASAEGNADSASDYPAIIGTGGALAISIAASGPTITGTAILTSLTETASITDVGKVSFTFEGNDTVGLVLATTGGATGTTTGTKYHGKAATATFGGNSFANMTSWSYTLTSGTADSTAMVGAGMTRAVGIFAGTATVTEWRAASEVAGTTVVTTGTSGVLVLNRVAGTIAATGTALCTGATTSGEKDGMVAITYTFKYNGTVANT